MNNSFDSFDKIYCVHLPEQTKRWELVTKQFKAVNILDRVEPISTPVPHSHCTMPALTYPIGELGCWLSHGKAIAHAIADNAEFALFLEDDVVFVPGAAEKLNGVMRSLPKDCDILMLGGTPRAKTKYVNDSLVKLQGDFFCATAYAIPQRSLLKFFDFWMALTASRAPIADGVTNRFAKKYNGYAAYPYICYQQPGRSIIRNSNRDYKKRLDGFWQQFGDFPAND